MSTKKELLGKENRKGNGHRRYSLLLLALLFIGFASYGTYAYFTSSTSTTRGQLTLNGLNSSYEVDKDDEGNMRNQNTGDGTTNKETDNNKEYNPYPDGNGKFEEVVNKDDTSQDEAHNSTQFGEFPWVYVGNNDGYYVTSKDLLNQSFHLTKFNSHVLATDDTNTEFNNVVEGDVFRKTVRLAVNGTSKVPMTAQLIWNGVADEDINNITAVAYVYVDNQTSDKKAQPFVDTNFKKYIDIKPAEITEEIGQVTAGQYIDVELVAVVNEGVNTEPKSVNTKDKADDLPNLAKISRQLKISLAQETSNVLKVKDK